MGLVGLGRVGSHVARRLVTGTCACSPPIPTSRRSAARSLGATLVDLPTLLAESDMVSLHASLTDETRTLIGEKALRAMKPTAILINTARGEIADEEAIARALTEGWIAGAALDAFTREPLPAASPLRAVDPERLILTPHNVGHSEAGRRANLALALEQILAAGRGEAPAHCVNPEGDPTLEELMSQAAYPISTPTATSPRSIEQVAKYLDAPYNRRPLNFSFYPWDGWDRRLLGTLGDLAGTAERLAARARPGRHGAAPSSTHPRPLHLLPARTAQWAVALCRAYNTFLHEEFVKKSPRLQAVALLPVQEPEASAARELRRAVTELGLVGAMLPADGGHLLGDARFRRVYEEAERLDVMLGIHASGSHLGGAGVDLFPQLHPGPHLLARVRADAPDDLDHLRGHPRALPRPAHRLSSKPAAAGRPTGWSGWTTSTPSAPRRRPCSRRSRATTSGAATSSSRARPTSGCCPQALKLIGENQIVYARDFPHWDHSYPASLDEIRERGDLNDVQKQKILADNARRLYRL